MQSVKSVLCGLSVVFVCRNKYIFNTGGFKTVEKQSTSRINNSFFCRDPSFSCDEHDKIRSESFYVCTTFVLCVITSIYENDNNIWITRCFSFIIAN